MPPYLGNQCESYVGAHCGELSPATIVGPCDQMIFIEVEDDIGSSRQQVDTGSAQTFEMLKEVGELGFAHDSPVRFSRLFGEFPFLF